MVDTEDMDKEDESENNRVCIFRVICPEVEEEADSLCLSLNENLQWRKQMSTSYLTIPDSCDQTSVFLCAFVPERVFASPFLCFSERNGDKICFHSWTTHTTTNALCSDFSMIYI